MREPQDEREGGEAQEPGPRSGVPLFRGQVVMMASVRMAPGAKPLDQTHRDEDQAGCTRHPRRLGDSEPAVQERERGHDRERADEMGAAWDAPKG
jgi:hypothetical protein